MSKFDKRKLTNVKWLASLFEKHRVTPKRCLSLKREGNHLCGCLHGPLAIELGFRESPEYRWRHYTLNMRARVFLDRVIGFNECNQIALGFDAWPHPADIDSPVALAANKVAHIVFGEQPT